MKNTKVGVVEIDSSQSILQGKTIPDTSQFDSHNFFDNGMWFWQYFDVGEGIYYTNTNVLFESGVEMSLHHVWASNDRPVVPETPLSTKRKDDHSLCAILCTEILYSDMLDTTEQLEKHFRKQL